MPEGVNQVNGGCGFFFCVSFFKEKRGLCVFIDRRKGLGRDVNVEIQKKWGGRRSQGTQKQTSALGGEETAISLEWRKRVGMNMDSCYSGRQEDEKFPS